MRDPAPWRKRYERMVGYAALFGLMSQYLFVRTEPGVSMALFVPAFYALFFYAVKGRIGGFEKWRGQFRSAWTLFIPIGLLTLTYAIFNNNVFRVLNVFALFALIIAQTVLLTKNSDLPWYRGKFYKELLFLSLVKPFSYIAEPFSIVISRFKGEERDDSKRGPLRKVLVGLLLAAPLLLVIVMLLASADAIFMSWINRIPNLLQAGSAVNAFNRLIAGGMFALYAFCYIWVLLFRKPGENSKADSAPSAGAANAKEAAALDPVTAGTFLLSINAVYLLFAGIQFSYLFGAADGMLPLGTAYAEYARRGFAELVLVSVINVCLLLGGLHRIKRAGRMAELVRRISLTSLVGCTIVMLVSAYSRLSLYEEAYGYTQTRLLVHGFMIYLALLCVIAVFRIWKERFSLAKAYITISIAAYVIMNYANIDAQIAAKNIKRYEQTGNIDLAYLRTLSTDAAPALYKLLNLDLEGADEAVAEMKNKAQTGGKWQSWSLSVERAK